MSINWYPGHMAKSKRKLTEQLKQVHALVELCDARIPVSSRNPELNSLSKNMPRVLVLNKADLADHAKTQLWLRYFNSLGEKAIAIQANNPSSAKKTRLAINDALKGEAQRLKQKGINKTLRLMVIGVPNVGKSTFINSLTGSTSLRAEDRPGITRAPQWVKMSEDISILDTPGMLWPKLEDQRAAKRLAYIAAIGEGAIDAYALCLELIDELMSVSPMSLISRYKLDNAKMSAEETLHAICKSRGFLLPGAELDIDRAVSTVLNEFRDGRIGKITLETPEEILDKE